MKTQTIFSLIGLMLLVAALAACGSPAPVAPPAVTVVQTQPTVAPTSAPVAGMANPASVYCVQQGGKSEIRKDAKGGEVGYCVFPDKSECEEWAFQRGECKPGTKPTTAAVSSADPFAYCATVANLDAPDARWTGAKVPDAVLTGLIQVAKLAPNIPKDQLAQSSFWRCMNGKVYACTVGANLPCQEKADTNKTPSAALNDFCKTNPASAVVPAVVTGRATVYEWKCVGGKPEVAKELFKPDARGFLSDFWYEIVPTTSAPGSSIANPASTNCIQQGGKLEIRKDAKGGEVGYCIFADKSECEEWAFMRGECKPGAKPVSVIKADNGKTMQAALGNIVEVVLEGAPGSTGYAWSLVSGNDAVLKPQFDPAKPLDQYQAGAAMPGAPGKFVFRFQAVAAGNATLKFVNKQAWVQDDPKAETFSVTVNVK